MAATIGEKGSRFSTQEMQNLPELPMHSSDLNSILCGEQLVLSYKRKRYGDILRHHVRFDESRCPNFRKILESFKLLMDKVVLSSVSNSVEDQERLLSILASYDASAGSSDDALFLQRLQCKMNDNHQAIFIRADEVMKKTRLTKHAFIPNVLTFLTELRLVILETLKANQPTDNTYESLFVTFGNIFSLPFRSGKVRKTSIEIFGQTVNCEPDLRYDLAVSTTGSENVAVVTVDKCYPCHKENASSSNPLKMGLPDNIRRRHTAHLLGALEESVQKSSDGKRCVLGLIVQATKVRLTCLEITNEHFAKLKEKTVSPNLDKTAFIYYSDAYDMFIEEERQHLTYILLALGTMGHRDTIDMPAYILPTTILEGYLQEDFK